ncbi:MAG TPA: glycosyltransferase family 4 protein [Bryobacteraceae bacterium]|jgi:glycosyltransferase involved in cell wall biosynthesis|nr:glycosyltransferase family 4 protein [Bryobacteraceae bacterium]
MDNRALKIAFLTNVIPPYHKAFLDCLAKRHEMRVLLSTPMEPNRSWKLEWDGLDVVTQKTLTLSGRWRHPRGFTEPLFLHIPIDTVAQLRRFGPDVTISVEMGARTLFAALYRKLRRRSKLIVWAEVAESTEQARGWIRNRVRHLLHKNADGFLVTGTSGVQYLRSLGVDEAKIFKISYTADVSKFAATPLARRPGCERHLLYVGQLIERKGLLPFLDVLSKWARANPDRRVEFVLAGDGPLRNQIERLEKPSNIEVSFAGAVQYEDLPRVYTDAGVFVLPSLADSWGVVVNEAMAAGLPVLGSVYAQAVSEMVKDGENGWVFRADDPDEIYDAIDRTLNTSPERLQRMRHCARTRALQFTPDHLACAVENAVNACMAMGAR